MRPHKIEAEQSRSVKTPIAWLKQIKLLHIIDGKGLIKIIGYHGIRGAQRGAMLLRVERPYAADGGG